MAQKKCYSFNKIDFMGVLGLNHQRFIMSHRSIQKRKFMSVESQIAISLHAIAAMMWVGGIFFAYRVLRPCAMNMEPNERVQLWQAVFRRFFGWVWLFISLIVVSGYWLIMQDFGGLEQTPLYLKVMSGIGWLMIVIFAWLFFGPFAKFKIRIAQYELAEAGQIMNTQMRHLIALNLMLGTLEFIIGATGGYWPI